MFALLFFVTAVIEFATEMIMKHGVEEAQLNVAKAMENGKTNAITANEELTPMDNRCQQQSQKDGGQFKSTRMAMQKKMDNISCIAFQ